MCRKRETESPPLSCSACGIKFTEGQIPVNHGNGGLLCLVCDYNESQSDCFANKSETINEIFRQKEKEIESLFLEPESDIGKNGLRSWQHNENTY